MTSEKSNGSWYFLGIVLLLYVTIYFFQMDKIISATNKTGMILLKILPIFAVVIILMTLTSYFLKPKFILKYLGKDSGIKGWIVSIIGGMLSTGPIYLWLPLLNELQQKGVRNAYLATFLYNRAIKLPLLPVLAIYLGITYTIVLSVLIILVSILQGTIIEKITGEHTK